MATGTSPPGTERTFCPPFAGNLPLPVPANARGDRSIPVPDGDFRPDGVPAPEKSSNQFAVFDAQINKNQGNLHQISK